MKNNLKFQNFFNVLNEGFKKRNELSSVKNVHFKTFFHSDKGEFNMMCHGLYKGEDFKLFMKYKNESDYLNDKIHYSYLQINSSSKELDNELKQLFPDIFNDIILKYNCKIINKDEPKWKPVTFLYSFDCLSTAMKHLEYVMQCNLKKSNHLDLEFINGFESIMKTPIMQKLREDNISSLKKQMVNHKRQENLEF